MYRGNIKRRRILTTVCLLGYACQAYAIVNMDDLHFREHRDGLSGSVNLQASSSSGNTQSTDVSFTGQLQWNRPQHINLLVIGYEYGKADDTRNQNKSFIHGRHVRQLSQRLDYEIFAQAEDNEFTRLTYRGLLGAGLRFPFANTANHVAYLGLGAFREVEKIAARDSMASDTINHTGRWNIYLMSRYKLAERIKFSNTFYWQPRMADSDDRRALFVSLLDIETGLRLSVQFSLETAYDSQPPDGVKKKDTKFKTGLAYRF